MEGVSRDDLRVELVPGRAPLFAAGSAGERFFTPFCVDTKSFVDDRLVTWLELLVVVLNVVNISLYFISWSSGVDRYVGTIAVSRMIMAVAVWRLQRDNLDGRVLRAQFRDATNWISNVLIVVNVVMIPLVRLWMRFETSWPGGGTRVAFEKAAWIAYSLLYPLPYGFFMLLDAFRRSSFAFRMAMVVFPMVRVAADFCYYSFPSLGLNSSPSLELLHVNFGLASQYIASGSFSILTAAAPFAVASYTHATDREWLVLAYEPKRRRAPDAADDPESGLGAGRGSNLEQFGSSAQQGEIGSGK